MNRALSVDWRDLKQAIRVPSGPIEYRGLGGADRVVHFPPARPPRAVKLSPRHERLVALLADGFSITEAAHKLGLGYKTATEYLTQARDRLGMRTTVQLVVWYARGGREVQRDMTKEKQYA